MNYTSKLLLTIAVGGIVLGLGLSRYASPTMNQAAGTDWRERYRMSYSDTSMQYVDAGPFDLSPALTWPGGPSGLSVMMQGPLDYASDYGPEYTAAELAISDEAGDDLAADPPLEPEPPAPPVQTAVRAAVATAETLDQRPDDRPEDIQPKADRMVSPNSFGSTSTLSIVGAPTPL